MGPHLCGGVPPHEHLPTDHRSPEIGLLMVHNCVGYRPAMRRDPAFWLSVQSLNQSGLLDLVQHRLLFLNNASAGCRSLGHQHGFSLMEPHDVLAHPERFSTINRPAPWEHLNPKGRTRREDPRSSRMMVVGTAMSFLMQSLPTTVRVALFVESDFVVSVSPASAQSQLIAAVAMVARGARVVRLQNTRGIGRPSGIPQATCCAPTTRYPTKRRGACSYSQGGGSWQRKSNWFNFYCDADMPRGLQLATCLREPTIRCFTSEDSNWSNRPFVADRRWFLHEPLSPRHRGLNVTMAQMALTSPDDNGNFEVEMLNINWARARVPLCLAAEGIFEHFGYTNGQRRVLDRRSTRLMGDYLADVRESESDPHAPVRAAERGL